MGTRVSKKERVKPNYRPYLYSAFESIVLESIFLLKPSLDKLDLKELIDEVYPSNQIKQKL